MRRIRHGAGERYAIITRMANRTFNIPKSKSTPKRVKIADTIDVAARYFVYKLYEATDGQPKVWGTLRGMGELRATSEGG